MYLWSKKFQAWFFPTQDTTEPETSLDQLPPATTSQLRSAIQGLPSPSVHRDAVQNALTAAIALWQENPVLAANSLVVLGSPVEPMEAIFSDALDALKEQNPLPVRRLLVPRPPDFTTIVTKLAASIAEDAPDAPTSQEHPELVVIPSLAEYFLRCIGGLAGIEYLRDTVLKKRSRFWLIGCNHWAWEYLGYVCQLKAFFEQTLSLPALTDSQIQDWLNSASTSVVKTRFIRSSFLPDNALLEEQLAELERLYFQKLSDISLGVSSVASELWLRSLRYQATDDSSGSLFQESPTLPDLPALTVSDRYLLHSLLLHEQMSLPALALSLGELENFIQPQVQVLRRSGLILQQQQLLKVNPLHYPRLKVELERNNFLVGEGN